MGGAVWAAGKREKKPRPESWESPGESRASREEESRTMPKNKGKGGKNRRRGKNEGEEKRELIFKEDGQEYAQVIRMLGNGRLDAQCIDGVKRLCHIRGNEEESLGEHG